jgi:hypothetical protein
MVTNLVGFESSDLAMAVGASASLKEAQSSSIDSLVILLRAQTSQAASKVSALWLFGCIHHHIQLSLLLARFLRGLRIVGIITVRCRLVQVLQSRRKVGILVV